MTLQPEHHFLSPVSARVLLACTVLMTCGSVSGQIRRSGADLPERGGLAEAARRAQKESNLVVANQTDQTVTLRVISWTDLQNNEESADASIELKPASAIRLKRPDGGSLHLSEIRFRIVDSHGLVTPANPNNVWIARLATDETQLRVTITRQHIYFHRLPSDRALLNEMIGRVETTIETMRRDVAYWGRLVDSRPTELALIAQYGAAYLEVQHRLRQALLRRQELVRKLNTLP